MGLIFFSLILNNRLINLKRFLFRLFYLNFPLLKWRPIFLTKKFENYYLSMKLLSLMYIIDEKTGVNFSWVILLVLEKN